MLIRYFAGAAEAAGTRTESVETADLTVDSLLAYLGAENPALAQVLSVSALLADGVRVEGKVSLRDVSQLDVLPPFAGG